MSKRYIIYEIRPLVKMSLTYSYVGSTQNFTKRKSRHKTNSNDDTNKDHNIHLYKFIRENGGWAAFEIVPLEEYDSDSVLQARIREQYWIDRNKSNLNSHKAFSGFETRDEYRKPYVKHYRKQYNEENRYKICEKSRNIYSVEKRTKRTLSRPRNNITKIIKKNLV